MALVGYVSDHRYVALAGVHAELLGANGASYAFASRASGSLHTDAPAGEYVAVLNKDGYGAKRVPITLPAAQPHQFRLLPDALWGYAWPKAVRVGERAEFRVHSPEQYRLELWRYGREKALVIPLGWYDEHGPRATVQISPDGDYSQTGVRWNSVGYANPDHVQYLTAPPRTGLYYFQAKGESGAFFSFPWVVAPERPSAPIAVLAGDLNWNAYNNFGGRSNYIHPEGMPAVPTANARMELDRYLHPERAGYVVNDYAPLSLDRPELINHLPEGERITDPIEGRAPNHIAPAEWRLLGWLEREGFAYDLYAESQFAKGMLDLDSYKVVITGPHPEYWTRDMYFRLKKWVHERGGRLLYLGGNGVNCEVELVDDGKAVVHHNGIAEEVTRNWESRFHARVEPEASLLGVVYDKRGIMTAAPYEVRDASHWVFEGTGLEDRHRFGERSQHMRIPGGASGHETDKISLANSPQSVRLLAKGLNPNDGGAEMALYETPSGGAVFAAGSICYISALWPDDAVSRITANVLRRMLR